MCHDSSGCILRCGRLELNFSPFIEKRLASSYSHMSPGVYRFLMPWDWFLKKRKIHFTLNNPAWAAFQLSETWGRREDHTLLGPEPIFGLYFIVCACEQNSPLTRCLLAGSFRYSCDVCGKKYKYYSCFQEHRDLHAVDGKRGHLTVCSTKASGLYNIMQVSGLYAGLMRLPLFQIHMNRWCYLGTALKRRSQ